ncbi:MAG: class II aldolase/adducin family protein [Lachnospiraceae bacterium]|nr:class II aldolase/adducin family protein [Lachnospiraceae bacterium]
MGEEKALREEICEIGRRMYARRMVAANDGNLSVRLSEEEILCTPTGVSKGFMKPEQLCKIDLSGNVLEMAEGFGPSSEVKMHLRVYQKRPDIMAVVHAHPIFATSFAVMGRALESPIMPEVIVNFGKIPLAPYGTPSTSEIPDAIEPYLSDYEAILLESHGALTWAKDLTAAYMKMESVEFYAELLYRTTQLGGPRELTEEKQKRLREVISDGV